MKRSPDHLKDKNGYAFKAIFQMPTLIISLLFLSYLIAQHAMVFLYHDDWGLSVLHYTSKQTGFTGQHFSLSQITAFLWDMYNNWSGRFVSLFFNIYLQKAGIWYIRTWQILAILLTIYFSYKITLKTSSIKRSFHILLLCMALFLAIPQRSLVGGIYWFSASSGYLWGMPFFLMGVYLRRENTTDKTTLMSYCLFAFSATFHELMAVVCLVYIGTHILIHRKGFQLRQIPFLLIPAAAATFTIFAPGNFVRKAVSNYEGKNIYHIITYNFDTIIRRSFLPNHIFTSGLSFFFALIVFSALVMLWKLLPVSFNSKAKIITSTITILIFGFLSNIRLEFCSSL